MKLLVDSGMPPGQVLAAATWNNAKVLRQEENLGSIAPEKFADMVLLDANPLENIENSRKVHRVVRSGRLLTPSQILKAAPRV
jgi:imidazolonepropionase-like amidohydrolase